MAGVDPALMISRQSAGGNDRVDMVMGQEVRTPRVQDGEEPDLGAEPFSISRHLEQGLGAGLEQQIEQSPAGSQAQRVQFVGHSEDNVKVVSVEQIALLRLEPSSAGLCLALGAAARSAGVIGDGSFVLAVLTLILVSAEGRSAAALHSPICLQLLIAENGLEALQKLPALATDDVSHFEGWPVHRRGIPPDADTLHRPQSYSTAYT